MGLVPDKKYLEDYLAIDGLVDEMYAVLTDKKFSRDKPTNPHKIKEQLDMILLDPVYPLHLLGLWGGSKEFKTKQADSADSIALENLTKLKNELKEKIIKYRKARERSEVNPYKIMINILFCDAHHIVANRVSLEDSLIYYKSLKELAEQYGFKVVRLADSNLVGLEPQISHYISPFTIPGISDVDSRIKARLLLNTNSNFADTLIASASKHSLWVKEDNFSPKDIARLYVEMEIYFLNLVPRKGIEGIYNIIYFSYSNPVIQKPIAESAGVPMLHLHSFSQGHHECPWYIHS